MGVVEQLSRHVARSDGAPTGRLGVIALALGCALVATLLPLGPQAGRAEAGERYRTWSFELRDICADGLPWTNDPPLGFPARWPRDEMGVPQIIVDGQRHYWPGALAINGMKRIDAFRDSGDARQVRQALLQAERLRIMMRRRRDAGWVPFTYDYPAAGQRAPWYNAMTQGLIVSFFVRLYLLTGDVTHREAATQLFRSFRRLGQRRKPWVAYVAARRDLWLEHYPRRRPDHVLNAHIHALIGIYEYWQLTRSAAARELLEGALTTTRRKARAFRVPGGVSLYGLRTRTRIAKYHEIHIWQFNLLARISGDAYFRRFARKLASDRAQRGHVRGRPAIRDRSVVGPHCRPTAPTTAVAVMMASPGGTTLARGPSPGG